MSERQVKVTLRTRSDGMCDSCPQCDVCGQVVESFVSYVDAGGVILPRLPKLLPCEHESTYSWPEGWQSGALWSIPGRAEVQSAKVDYRSG